MDVIETEGVPVPANLVNVVATFQLQVRRMGTLAPRRINLRKVCLMLRDVLPMKYNPKKFAAMTISTEMRKLGFKGVAALLFATGNVVFTGGDSEERVLAMAHYLTAALVRTTKIGFHLTKFCIANLVCATHLGKELDLRGMKRGLGSKAKLKTTGERAFPACRIKPKANKAWKILAYTSGAAVMTGPKTRNGMHRLHSETWRLLSPYGKSAADANIANSVLHVRDRKESTDAGAVMQIERSLNAWSEVASASRSATTTIPERAIPYRNPLTIEWEHGAASSYSPSTS